MMLQSLSHKNPYSICLEICAGGSQSQSKKSNYQETLFSSYVKKAYLAMHESRMEKDRWSFISAEVPDLWVIVDIQLETL